MLRVLHDPPLATPFTIVLKRWRRQLTATAEDLRFKVSLAIRGIPAHAWNAATARQLLSPACLLVQPLAAPLSSTDLRQFAAEASCVHPDLIPCERLMFIPEPDVPREYGPPLFLQPEEVIHQSQLALWYRIFIDIIEVEDWCTLSESSAGSDSDSGTNGIPGSRITDFSHQWPKHIHLTAPEVDSSPGQTVSG
jgi:hypothetical protein